MRVLVPIAHGSEDLETVAVVDVLRRAGVEVTIASVEDNLIVVAARGTRIQADCGIDAVQTQRFDMIAVPGGMPGAQTLAKHAALGNMIREHHSRGDWVAGICAAPAVVLQPLSVLDQVQRVRGYPAFKDILGDKYVQQPGVSVCTANRIITASGAGQAVEFALELVRGLRGPECADEVAQSMLL
jgi:protein deglycase